MTRVRLALLIAIAGCHSDDAPVCLRDGFDTIASSRWKLMDPAHTDVTATGGRLVIAPPALTATNDGVRGSTVFDLTGGFAEIEIGRYLVPSDRTQGEFVIRLDEA